MQHLGTLQQILRERLPAEAGKAIVRHVLGNPVQVEFVSEVRRALEGRIVGIKIRPRGGTSPTVMKLVDGDFRFEKDGRPVGSTTVEPRDPISLLVATEGFGQYLPAIYSRGMQREEGEGGVDFLRRFLLLFQTLDFEVQSRVGARDRIVSPVDMDPRFLPWLASWLDFHLDERIPVTRRRIFLRRAVHLFKKRGTIDGLREIIKTLTGLEVELIERRGPQPLALGNCALSTPDDVQEQMALPYVTNSREHLLVSPRFRREEYFTIVLDNREDLVRHYREDRLKALLEQVVRVVKLEKPAHLSFVINFRDEEAAHDALVLCAAGEMSPNAVLGRVCLLGAATRNHGEVSTR